MSQIYPKKLGETGELKWFRLVKTNI